MPDARHFDDVAMRHNDPLTRWFEDALDDADEEAEAYERGRHARDAAAAAYAAGHSPGGGQLGPTPQDEGA